MAYEFGQAPFIDITFTDQTKTPPEPFDPDVVTFILHRPDETKLTYVFGTAPELTKLAVGGYRFSFATLPFDDAHTWGYAARGTGSKVAAKQGSLEVLESTV